MIFLNLIHTAWRKEAEAKVSTIEASPAPPQPKVIPCFTNDTQPQHYLYVRVLDAFTFYFLPSNAYADCGIPKIHTNDTPDVRRSVFARTPVDDQ